MPTVILINPIEVQAAEEEQFLSLWQTSAEHMRHAPGFRSLRLHKSDLDWTVIRPPMLTNGPRTGEYRTAMKKHLSAGWAISRANLADYIVTHWPIQAPTARGLKSPMARDPLSNLPGHSSRGQRTSIDQLSESRQQSQRSFLFLCLPPCKKLTRTRSTQPMPV